MLCMLCFFFQAEDGIRDSSVTGVQTCALPIFAVDDVGDGDAGLAAARDQPYDVAIVDGMLPQRDGLSMIEELRRRSEERRGGKEYRDRDTTYKMRQKSHRETMNNDRRRASRTL